MGRFIDPEKHAIANLSTADWLVMLGVAVVCILVSFVSTIDKALATGMTFGVLAELVVLRRRSRHDPRMWALVAAVAAVQIPAIFLVRMPRISVSDAVVPFAVIEGLALWTFLNWIERRFPRSESVEQ